jgi:hypothetical protein
LIEKRVPDFACKDWRPLPTNHLNPHSKHKSMKKSPQKNPTVEAGLSAQDHLAYEQQISRRAYELWQAAGSQHGDDLRHWLEAEREKRSTPEIKIRQD